MKKFINKHWILILAIALFRQGTEFLTMLTHG